MRLFRRKTCEGNPDDELPEGRLISARLVSAGLQRHLHFAVPVVKAQEMLLITPVLFSILNRTGVYYGERK